MDWDWGKIWNDGWIFYSATLGLFGFGIVYECIAVYRSGIKFKSLASNIKVLKENQARGSAPNSGWLKEHLLFDKTDPSDRKFRLQQYPREIAVVPRSSLRFIPPILTAIGVLGTFWGMSAGLMGVNIDPNEVNQSLSSAITLIAGMKTAFITSLLGLGTSTALSAFLAVTDKLRRGRCYKLRQELDAIAVLETPERAMSRLNFDSTAEAAKQLAGLASQFNAEAIGAAVGRAIALQFDLIVDSRLAPTFKKIAESQLRLEKITNDQSQVLSNLIGDMRTELIDPVTQKLDQSSKLLNYSAKVLGDASKQIQSLNENLGGIAEKLAIASSTLADFQNETMMKLTEFAESLKKTLTEFRTSTNDVLVSTAKEIREGTKEILTQAQMTFQEQNDILRTVGQETSDLMISSRESLVASLTNIDTRLQHMSDTTQQQLETFQVAYQRNLQEFFDRQNNLLEESLGTQRDGLAGVVRELDAIFREEYERRKELTNDITARVKEIQNAAISISKLGSAVESSHAARIEQLTEISRSVGDQIDRLEISNQRLTDNYQVSMQSLEKMLQQMINGEQDFFKQADLAMARVSGGLLDAANVLVEVHKEVKDK
ncbi:hypothetical protein [Pseudanabaena mucicola]|uniref:MotA/TolQ/ExbB proton channel domain-containing protein n=1 Tax=Pseudanabaena mucicola FACHB-723 TaxID=2692860 RepID=A0ABR8A1X4_9CYAN|nr:hypothetical protein [Pseudanabaena mucicola]MBD2190023.1 hypothetical protein [Pseudanabaena mucicola FACHB-723]